MCYGCGWGKLGHVPRFGDVAGYKRVMFVCLYEKRILNVSMNHCWMP